MRDYSNIILCIRSHSSLFQIQIQKYMHEYNTLLLIILINRSHSSLFQIQIQAAENATFSIHFPCPLMTAQKPSLQRREFYADYSIGFETSSTIFSNGQLKHLAILLFNWKGMYALIYI